MCVVTLHMDSPIGIGVGLPVGSIPAESPNMKPTKVYSVWSSNLLGGSLKRLQFSKYFLYEDQGLAIKFPHLAWWEPMSI